MLRCEGIVGIIMQMRAWETHLRIIFMFSLHFIIRFFCLNDFMASQKSFITRTKQKQENQSAKIKFSFKIDDLKSEEQKPFIDFFSCTFHAIELFFESRKQNELLSLFLTMDKPQIMHCRRRWLSVSMFDINVLRSMRRICPLHCRFRSLSQHTK